MKRSLKCFLEAVLSTRWHDVKQPPVRVGLLFELAATGALAAEPSKTAQYLQSLQQEGQREIRLIDDFLSLVRLEAGTEPLMLTTIA